MDTAPTSPDVVEIINPSVHHPAAAFLEKLIRLMEVNQANDVMLCQKGPIMAEVNKLLEPAKNWPGLTDNAGNFLPDEPSRKNPVDGSVIEGRKGFNFAAIREALLEGTTGESTVFYRLKSLQVRVEVLKDVYEEKILLRLQTLAPPPVESVFAANPKSLEIIANARGLVVICGRAGGGKTTLASGIVQYLAGLKRHVITLEDPVEYYLRPARGKVSQLSCRMSDTGNPAVPTVKSYTEKILRGNAKAVYIGETRTDMAVDTCLEFAAADALVLTTFNAGSITDALARFITKAGKVMGEQTARMMMAQCVEVFVYVNLAYTKLGVPVPVITCLPVDSSGIALRKYISENSPLMLASQVESQLRSGQPSTGVISREMAVEYGKKMGATEESVEKALPQEGRFSKPTTPTSAGR